MRRIFTSSIALVCLLLASQVSNAQTCSVSTTNPNPSPGFGGTYAITAGEGFTGNRSPITGFPENNVTSNIVSQAGFFYSTAQTSVYFKLHLTSDGSQARDITAYTISVKYGAGAGTTQSCSSGAVAVTVPTGGGDFYFRLAGILIPNNTNFRLTLTMTIGAGGGSTNNVVLSAFQINAVEHANGVLPVHFSSFDAKKSGSTTNLVWKTDLEDNVSGFDVERSADGKNFSKIGFVAAANRGTYTFTDAKSLSGTSYYRIKSVDLDGKYMYSTVITLKGENSLTVLKAFPMPVSSDLTIQHDAATATSKITISSEDGRLVKAINPTVGNIQTSLNVSSLKAGLYLVRFDNGNGNTETIKVVKQ
jgi:hypothetical protein